MMTSQQIRQQYIDFFVQKHGHTFVPSSPVVPHDDPTLLFTNAGMNQFKPYFLGTEKAPWKRVANTQKCIRAGGKHNDLDDVGRSRRHHTFFEMLGNWSLGDYFKREAIEMAWELLTKIWKIDPTRLHVTCYEGDEKNGVPRDTEAADLWKQITGLPDDRIHYFGADNFWEMGDTGPCGPCSEIHIDRTPEKSGGKDVNGSNPAVMEIWNLVFIQYNRNPDRTLTPLPAKHVDTGMGFERICHILQGKDDNYAIDLWTPLFDAISQISNLKYTGLYPPTNAPDPVAETANPQLRTDIAFRVIADHLRCLTFALTDGAVPSNEGRGYVLRRILRRVVFWGWQHLKIKDPFIHKLVPALVDSMGGAFPELKKNPRHVQDLIKDEEVSFGKALARGIDLFDVAAREAATRFIRENPDGLNYARTIYEAGQTQYSVIDRPSGEVTYGPPADWSSFRGPGHPAIRGSNAFILHDTYGFPIDLTRIMAEERGMTVDIAAYEKLMETAKERSRADVQGVTAEEQARTRLLQEYFDVGEATHFVGYETLTTSGQRRFRLFRLEPQGYVPVANANEGDQIAFVVDETPFYAEGGGQVADRGYLIHRETGGAAVIDNVKKSGSIIFHVARVTTGHLVAGNKSQIELIVDDLSRMPTMKNHTATHLANWALRKVLGDGVQQKGSLVDPEKLRFDFSHSKTISDEEIEKIEKLVADRIEENLTVYEGQVRQEEALRINGLRAVFGEKYPPMVRVVSIGAAVPDLLDEPTNSRWREYSIEFCGGTHVKNTGDIESFVITAEESVSKGIRRIVAVTGKIDPVTLLRREALKSTIADVDKLPEEKITWAIGAIQGGISEPGCPLLIKRAGQRALAVLQQRQKAQEKAAKKELPEVDAIAIGAQLLAEAEALGPGKLIIGPIPGASDDQLRSAMDSLKKKSPSHGILLASATDGKVTFVAAVSDDLIAKGLKAGDWVREAAKVTGGGGGGRPQMAQAGGKDPTKLDEALTVAKAFARRVTQA